MAGLLAIDIIFIMLSILIMYCFYNPLLFFFYNALPTGKGNINVYYLIIIVQFKLVTLDKSDQQNYFSGILHT